MLVGGGYASKEDQAKELKKAEEEGIEGSKIMKKARETRLSQLDVQRKSDQGNSLARLAGISVKSTVASTKDFRRGDVGRKKFGFSREEFDEPSPGFYEGQFRFMLRHGHGTLVYTVTGDKYVGQFANERFHGEGTRMWSDGSRHKGRWSAGMKHGYGTFTSDTGLTYEGQWKDGKRHGAGHQEFENGDSYEGFWANGLMHGKGTYTFDNGDRFDGGWKSGGYDGDGVVFFAGGGTEKRSYKNGVLQERAIIKDSVVKRKKDWKMFYMHPLDDVVKFDAAVFRFMQTRKDVHESTLPPLPDFQVLHATAPLSARAAAGAEETSKLDDYQGAFTAR